jgi:hypothetical protein
LPFAFLSFLGEAALLSWVSFSTLFVALYVFEVGFGPKIFQTSLNCDCYNLASFFGSAQTDS